MILLLICFLFTMFHTILLLPKKYRIHVEFLFHSTQEKKQQQQKTNTPYYLFINNNRIFNVQFELP